jgi:hypothetical protein
MEQLILPLYVYGYIFFTNIFIIGNIYAYKKKNIYHRKYICLKKKKNKKKATIMKMMIKFGKKKFHYHTINTNNLSW